MVTFLDRIDAGRQLALKLRHLRGTDVVVLGLPRGGVPVAAEVAAALAAPLDVIVVRKLGVPFEPEVAMGAIGEDGAHILDRALIAAWHISDADVNRIEWQERAQLDARIDLFRRGRSRINLAGHTALIIDDGIATGQTARAACLVARKLGARRVVLAAPVAAADTVASFTEADEVVCVSTPILFSAVGEHYRDFRPTEDHEVVELLDDAARRMQRTGLPHLIPRAPMLEGDQ